MLREAQAAGQFLPDQLPTRDHLDMQVLLALAAKAANKLTTAMLDKCLSLVRAEEIEPSTQVVYASFVFDIARDAGVACPEMLSEIKATGFDWEAADALSGISRNFDARVAAIRAVATPPQST